MPDKIANPIPAWLTESPSVLDSPLKRAMQMIGSLIGADNPTSQVLGMAGAMEVPGKLGGLAGAVDRLLTKAGIKAYHGSPHDFDQFSTEKIGTGEGAQAYGHGLYFAENEGVAKGYRDQVSAQAKNQRPHIERVRGWVKGGLSPDDARTQEISGIESQLDEARFQLRAALAEGTRQTRATINPVDVGRDERALVQHLQEQIAEIKAWPTADLLQDKPGRMYEVNIAAHPDDFLDWDKPLSQQSEKVRQALGPDLLRDEYVSAAGKHLVDATGDTLLGIKLQSELRKNGGDIQSAFDALSQLGNESWKAKITEARRLDWSGLSVRSVEAPGVGANLVSDLERRHGKEGMNAYLQGKGVAGIRYLDAGSRGAGDGSRNYVVFDDKLVSILKKYGVAGALAAGYSQSDVDAAQSHP